jgi:hypothetical protein
MNQNQNQQERQIHEEDFKTRKQFGDVREDCIKKYLGAKYHHSQITHREEEKEKDFKLPDFVVRHTKDLTYEIEVKGTSKIKLNDFNYQYQYAIKNKLLVYYFYVKILDSHRFIFRPIEIRDLLDYRVFESNGVYNDSIPKPFFIVDWNLYFQRKQEKDWTHFSV